MIDHEVRVHPESERLGREEQLAWKIALVASDPVAVEAEVAEMRVDGPTTGPCRHDDDWASCILWRRRGD